MIRAVTSKALIEMTCGLLRNMSLDRPVHSIQFPCGSVCESSTAVENGSSGHASFGTCQRRQLHAEPRVTAR